MLVVIQLSIRRILPTLLLTVRFIIIASMVCTWFPLNAVVIYNCSYLSMSCSSCLSLRLRADEFDCGWCRRIASGHNDCTVSQDCTDPQGSFFTVDESGQFCPRPVVRYIVISTLTYLQ